MFRVLLSSNCIAIGNVEIGKYFDQISWNIPWSSVIIKVEKCNRFPPKCIEDEVKTQKAHNNL